MGNKGMIMCDSNILIQHLRGDVQVKENLRNIGVDRLAISIITFSEVYMGTPKNKKKAIKRYLDSFQCYDLNREVSKLFKELIVGHGLFRDQKWISDALIASTAVSNNLELYTNNKKDFDFIDRIKFYNP